MEMSGSEVSLSAWLGTAFGIIDGEREGFRVEGKHTEEYLEVTARTTWNAEK